MAPRGVGPSKKSVLKERESRPARKERDSHAARKERESHPVRKERESNPVRKERESNPVRKEREATPVRKEREPDVQARRRADGHSGVPLSTNKMVTEPAASFEDSSPGIEGYCKGSWWDVRIIEERSQMFLVRYIGNSGDDEAWLPLNHLRLRTRETDDWDCSLLKRGIEVSVFTTHPDYKVLTVHPKGLYDAKIIDVSKVQHNDSYCLCKFTIRFFCIKENYESESPMERLTMSGPKKEVSIKDVRILQQEGIFPVSELLKAHILGKRIPGDRLSSDAYFLREAALSIVRSQGLKASRFLGQDNGYGAGTPSDRNPQPSTVCAANKHEFSMGARVTASPGQEKMSPNSRIFLGTRKSHSSAQDGLENSYHVVEGDNYEDKHNDHGGKKVERREIRKRDRLDDWGIRSLSKEQDVGATVRSTRSSVKRGGEEMLGPRKKKLETGEAETSKRNLSQENEQEVKNSERVSVIDSWEDDCLQDVPIDCVGNSDGECNPDGSQKKNSQEKDIANDCEVKTNGRNVAAKKSEPYKRVLVEVTSRVGTSSQTRRSGRPRQKCKDVKNKGDEIASCPGDTPSIEDALNGNIKQVKSGLRDTSSDNERKTKASVGSKRKEDFSGSAKPREEKGGTKNLDINTNSTEKAKGSPVIENKDNEFNEKEPELPTTKRKGAVGRPRGKSKLEPVKSANKEDTGVDMLGKKGAPKVEPRYPFRNLKPPNDGMGKKRSGANTKSRKDPSNGKQQNSGKKEGDFKRRAGRPLYLDLLGDTVKEEFEASMMVDVDKDRKDEQIMSKVGHTQKWGTLEEGFQSDSDCKIIEEEDPLLKELWKEYDLEVATPGAIEKARTPTSRGGLLPGTSTEKEVQDQACLDGKHDYCLKEDAGMVCSVCGYIGMTLESMVPVLDSYHRRTHDLDIDDWDFVRSNSPDTHQEVAAYELKIDKKTAWMNSCLPIRIQQKMYPHQKDGFEFLWRNLSYEEGNFRMMRKDKNAGCILSHAPGTGKSFLVIAFLQSYMNKFPNCRPLIVAPKIMLRQWEREFKLWKSDITVLILNTANEQGRRLVQNHEEAGVISNNFSHMSHKKLLDIFRLATLFEWTQKRGVCLVSYNLFASLTDEGRTFSTAEGNKVREGLLDIPGLLILDEGHFPRNKGTRIHKSLMRVKTNVRILLSGTLFQNNFEELFNTLYLVRPGFVEAFSSFVPNSSAGIKSAKTIDEVTKAAENKARKLFVDEVGLKIEQGQKCGGLSENLLHGLQRLQTLTSEFVHHHTGEVLANLPGLRDFAVILKPTPLQCALLDLVEKQFCRPIQALEKEVAVSETSIHPSLLPKLEFAKCLELKSIFKSFEVKKNKSESSCSDPLTACPTSGGDDAGDLCGPGMTDPCDGIKTKFVFDMLRCCKLAKEKVLIFSQHLSPLELLEEMFCSELNWYRGREFLRLDGKLRLDERQTIIEKFNDPYSDAAVLIASTRACGEGITLVGASRVIFLDVLWNPAVIKQAMSRAFRLGQKKIVYVYRLITSGTIEEKKYKKAIRKDWLSRSIFSSRPHTESCDASDEAEENGLPLKPEVVSNSPLHTEESRQLPQKFEVDHSQPHSGESGKLPQKLEERKSQFHAEESEQLPQNLEESSNTQLHAEEGGEAPQKLEEASTPQLHPVASGQLPKKLVEASTSQLRTEESGQLPHNVVEVNNGVKASEDVLAWIVDVSKCGDSMLEKILETEWQTSNSIVKVVEHGSTFHECSFPCGPDARDWIMEEPECKESIPDDEERDTKVPATEVIGEAGEMHPGAAASSSDTDEDELEDDS